MALNSTSLALAVIANFFLFLNMNRRVPFFIAQPIIIISYLLAALFLFVIIGITSQPSWKGGQDFILTEAFYYATYAAGLYTIIGVLMIFTTYGAYVGHYKDLQIKGSQRTLMVQTVVFMAYLLIGAAIFAKVEGWNYLDSVYFADFTMLTIGTGGWFVPRSHLARSLVIPYSIGGLVNLGLLINAINRQLIDASHQKLAARAIERKREQVLKRTNYEKGYYLIEWYRRRYFDKSDNLSELDRRKQEFWAMRDIIRYANSGRSWRSLAVSISAVSVLWFVGAAILYITEAQQGWSYFEAVYFAYCCLVTLGFGDFEPQSDAGRSFFVLWTLLAIPAITTLVGDLNKTVGHGARDLKDYFLRLITRPGHTVKDTTKYLFTPNYLPSNFSGDKNGVTNVTDLILSRLQQEDVMSAERAGKTQELKLRDRRFYCFLLMRDIRQVLTDCEHTPDKEYSFEEWCYYLKLLGLDEENKEIHCAPAIKPTQQPDGSPGEFNLAYDIDDDGIVQPWSWLGIRSPLMSGKTEPQWISRRLIIRLQRELHLENMDSKEVPLQLSLIRRETGTLVDVPDERENSP